jgi:transcription antitermination factor NusG
MRENVYPADFEQSKWYVLFVRSNQEKRVAGRLCDRAVEYFLPCYTSLRKWKDRRVQLTIPLFPGYIFVRLPLVERLKALTVPNVVSLVGTKDAPSEVSEDELAWIRRGIEHGDATPHERLEAGQRVVITDGAMAGMEGVLLRKQNKTRVIVSLQSIPRAFSVEVEAACIRPLNRQSRWSFPREYNTLFDYSRNVVASVLSGPENSLVASSREKTPQPTIEVN